MSSNSILFLAPTVPWPADSGGRIRTSKLIEHAGRDARITLFAVSPPGQCAPPPASILSACERVEVFTSEQARDVLRPGPLPQGLPSSLVDR